MQMRCKIHTTPLLTASIITLVIGIAGCTGIREGSLPANLPAGMNENLLRLETHDRTVFSFSNDWTVTMSGIKGSAVVEPADGTVITKDTTVSYYDITSAAGTGRGKTVSQFLLTVLGVVLIIGLAAIVLYAAFLATDR
jgi:hypothetical protein